MSTVVLFPAPPPTTNALSAAQRTRLVRSSKKIGKILGLTPHFVDVDDLHKDLSPIDSSPLRPSSRASSLESPSADHDSWPTRRPPMLRLPIPTSSATKHRRSSPLDGSPSSLRRTLPNPSSTDTQTQPSDSPTAPTFTIPTPSSLRRLKMDRVRRKLGEDVPIGLVFPRDDEYGEQEDSHSESDSVPALSPSSEEGLLSSSSSSSSSSSEDDSLVTPTDNTSLISIPISSSKDDEETAESWRESDLFYGGAKDKKPEGKENEQAVLEVGKSTQRQLMTRGNDSRRRNNKKKIAHARDSMDILGSTFTFPSSSSPVSSSASRRITPTRTRAAGVPAPLHLEAEQRQNKIMTIVHPSAPTCISRTRTVPVPVPIVYPTASRPAPPPPPSPTTKNRNTEPQLKLKPKPKPAAAKSVLKKLKSLQPQVTSSSSSPPTTLPSSTVSTSSLSSSLGPRCKGREYSSAFTWSSTTSPSSSSSCTSAGDDDAKNSISRSQSQSRYRYRSRSGSSSTASSLAAIPEETQVHFDSSSEWFDGDNLDNLHHLYDNDSDDDGDFDFISQDEVLEATMLSLGLGLEGFFGESKIVVAEEGGGDDGTTTTTGVLFSRLCGGGGGEMEYRVRTRARTAYGMGRGLARSYGRM